MPESRYLRLQDGRRGLRVVAISDTHGLHDEVEVPEGDILVHAGDLTSQGRVGEVAGFARWLRGLPHRHKIVIAGNHDFAFERAPARARSRLDGCVYLEDAGAEVLGLRFYGSPWQPWFFDWAFNLSSAEELRAKWERIPAGTDLLITHGPPRGHGDLTDGGESAGCEELLAAVRRVRPLVHIFGHIHEGYGVTYEGSTACINASICTIREEPLNAPWVIDL